MNEVKLDLMNLPENIFEKRAKIFLFGIEERSEYSIKFINNDYKNKELLKKCLEFIDSFYIDGFKGDFESISRIEFFPGSEAQMELDNSINHAIICSYKAAYDHLRRGLELTLIAVYLTSEFVNKINALNWLNSKANTPLFSETINKVVKLERFRQLNDKYNWKNDIQNLYWEICDFIHVKGRNKGFRVLNRTNIWIGGVSMPSFSEKTLENYLENFNMVVSNICCLLATYNPVLLVELPLDDKFGLGGPISGFYQKIGSELIMDLIPIKYKAFFEDLKENDIEVKSIIEWINNLPDLTKVEFEKQVEEFHREFRNKNTPNIDRY